MKINETIEKYLSEARSTKENMEDYFVQNQRGYKSPLDAYKDKDMYLYMNMLLQVMSRKGKMKIGNWEASEDQMVGTWGWYKKGDDSVAIYMTPFWEGSKGIDAAWQDDEGNYDNIGDQKFKVTGDMKKDFDAYMAVAKRVLSKFR